MFIIKEKLNRNSLYGHWDGRPELMSSYVTLIKKKGKPNCQWP